MFIWWPISDDAIAGLLACWFGFLPSFCPPNAQSLSGLRTVDGYARPYELFALQEKVAVLGSES